MKLNEVKWGWPNFYWDIQHQLKVILVISHPDDGACLIAEVIEDGDITGKLVYTEASNLRDA